MSTTAHNPEGIDSSLPPQPYRFSLAKRRCGMGLVTAKLRETAAHVIAMSPHIFYYSRKVKLLSACRKALQHPAPKRNRAAGAGCCHIRAPLEALPFSSLHRRLRSMDMAVPIVWKNAKHFRIELTRMIYFFSVAQFMDNHTVDHLGWSQNQQTVEVQIPLGTATTPSGGDRRKVCVNDKV